MQDEESKDKPQIMVVGPAANDAINKALSDYCSEYFPAIEIKEKDKMHEKIIGMAGLYASMMPPAKKERIIGYYDPSQKQNINRNDPCHCGSGVKFKKCCLNKK